MSSVIDLSGAMPAWPVASVRHLRSCMERAPLGSYTSTPPEQGEAPLRAALAQVLGDVPERLVVTSGVRSGAAALLSHRPVVVLEEPTFEGIRRLAAASAGEVMLRPWGEPFATALERQAPGALGWLTSPWRNPDGACLDESFARRLAGLVAQGHTIVVNEVYRWSAHEPVTVAGALLAGSLAKVCGGGVRLGWLRGDAPPERAVSDVPAPWQLALARFIEEDGLAPLVVRNCQEPAAACAAFVAALAPEHAARLTGSPGSPHLLLETGARAEADVCAWLLARGVKVGAGADFNSPRPAVRVSFFGVTPDEAAAAAVLVADAIDSSA